MMALFAFFQRADSVLPKLDGPVSTAVPLWTIMAVIKSCDTVETGSIDLSSMTGGTNLYPMQAVTYNYFTPKQKVRI